MNDENNTYNDTEMQSSSNYDEVNQNETVTENNIYMDGEDNKPKIILIIGAIVFLLAILFLILFACSKANKKSDNYYLKSIKINEATLKPAFKKNVYEYTVSTTKDAVEIICSAESNKASTSGCKKRIILEDSTCVDHNIIVISESGKKKTYSLKICKATEEQMSILKSIDVTPSTYTNKDVVVTINVNETVELSDEAYSIDNGLTWQKENTFTISENKTLNIVVKAKDGTEIKNIKEINNIDKVIPKVSIKGSVESGKSSASNVELVSITDPTSVESGYKYQWYKNSSEIKGATKANYVATSSGEYKVKVTTGSGNTSMSDVYKVVKTSTSSGGSSKTTPKSNTYKLTIDSVTGNPTNWTNKPITLTVKATASNGLNAKAYSFDGGKTYQSSNSKQFSGNQVVNIVVKDKKNNTVSYKVYITKIDLVKPSVSITGNKLTGSALIAKTTPEITSSGFKYQWYKGSSAISGATKNNYTPTSAGNYSVKVTTYAGNSATSETVSVTNPIKATISLSGDVTSGTWTKGTVKLTAKVSNGTASSYEWKKDSSNYSSCSKNTCTLKDDQSSNYVVRAKLSNGSYTDWSSPYKVNIDKTAPTISVTAKLGDKNGASYSSNLITSKNIYFSITYKDNYGMKSYGYSSSDLKNINTTTKASITDVMTAKSATTYKFTATDKAGNTITKEFVVNKQTTPQAPEIVWVNENSTLLFKLNKSKYASDITLEYSFDKKTWKVYDTIGKKITLLKKAGSKTVYARSKNESNKYSSITQKTGTLK